MEVDKILITAIKERNPNQHQLQARTGRQDNPKQFVREKLRKNRTKMATQNSERDENKIENGEA